MSTFKRTAILRLKNNSKELTSALLEALTPEALSSQTNRSKVRIEKEGEFLILKVEAEDTISLRATLNAYLHWINSMTIVIGKLP
jgi:tRNA threonylcarbamoyladenosine modification (KEOPS) complex  Pcc1 subunit